MDKLVEAMKTLLANTFAFYVKAQGFHWNVEGPNFPQYHQLFGCIYTEVYGSIDKMAEEIRAMDSYVPAGLSKFDQISEISDETKIPSARGMLEKLVTDNELMLRSILTAYELAEANKIHGLSNFLAERQDAHKKHRWQLTATLKNTGSQ